MRKSSLLTSYWRRGLQLMHIYHHRVTTLPSKYLSTCFCDHNRLLPPVNEVWGKVMFLHMSVILSTGGGGLCMMSLPVWLAGPMFLLGALCLGGLCPGGSLWGVSPQQKPRTVKSGRCTSYWNAFLFIYSYRQSSYRISSDHWSFYSRYPISYLRRSNYGLGFN